MKKLTMLMCLMFVTSTVYAWGGRAVVPQDGFSKCKQANNARCKAAYGDPWGGNYGATYLDFNYVQRDDMCEWYAINVRDTGIANPNYDPSEPLFQPEQYYQCIANGNDQCRCDHNKELSKCDVAC